MNTQIEGSRQIENTFKFRLQKVKSDFQRETIKYFPSGQSFFKRIKNKRYLQDYKEVKTFQ